MNRAVALATAAVLALPAIAGAQPSEPGNFVVEGQLIERWNCVAMTFDLGKEFVKPYDEYKKGLAAWLSAVDALKTSKLPIRISEIEERAKPFIPRSERMATARKPLADLIWQHRVALGDRWKQSGCKPAKTPTLFQCRPQDLPGQCEKRQARTYQEAVEWILQRAAAGQTENQQAALEKAIQQIGQLARDQQQ